MSLLILEPHEDVNSAPPAEMNEKHVETSQHGCFAFDTVLSRSCETHLLHFAAVSSFRRAAVILQEEPK